MKPTALKILKGSLNVTRANKREPLVVAIDPPPPPDNLTTNQARAWTEIAEALAHLRTITPADLPAFRALVASQAAIYDAEHDPSVSPNAMINMRRALMADLGKFGMTPVDRQRVVQLEAPEANRYAKYRTVPGK